MNRGKDRAVLVLSGGVGGAKLVRGLARAVPDCDLRVIVNTADDFEFHGLHICPDLDTVMYALSGLQNEQTGWGIQGDSWNAHEMLGRYGAPTWFRLGDRDLATHLVRTKLLREGQPLSVVTRSLASALGVAAALQPMTDDRVETFVQTEEGELAFQEYFVREGTHPAVRGVRFAGIEAADPSEVLLGSIREVELIVIAPSNPVASIEPILALPGVREQLQRSRALRVAVSPIIGGRALKGPTVQFLEAVGVEATAVGIAGHYRDVLDTLVVDRMDAGAESEIRRLGLDVIVGDTVMRTGEDRVRVARLALSSLWPSEQ